METYDALDLFAGPGGWDIAARDLGLTTLGLEFDAAACETRRAAGLATIEGDVRDFGPSDWPGVPGLIASPPCQTFSMAGKGAGRTALDDVLLGVKTLAARQTFDASVFADERTGLVLEPLRWALQAIDAGRPFHWLAFEQVPTVLPVWEAMAEALRAEGYSVATGKLYAEQYGVPQTRTRVVLVARLDGEARLPEPTHSRYYSRSPEKLDEGVLPWVSMAEALGWRTETAAEVAGRWVARKRQTTRRVEVYGDRPDRPVESPAFTVLGQRRFEWVFTRPSTSVQGDPHTGQPGHKCMTDDCHPGRGKTKQFDTGSVRVTVEEAATLQSFPGGYPWQGTKSERFLQVGNAVPPLLARAVLSNIAPPDLFLRHD